MQLAVAGLRRQQLLWRSLAILHRKQPEEWRLVGLEQLLCHRLRRKRHADANVQLAVAGLRRQQLLWCILAGLHREQPEGRRMADGALARLEQLLAIRRELQANPKPHSHLHRPRLRGS